jgi:ABC-type multidrug transport system ATPase subunit
MRLTKDNYFCVNDMQVDVDINLNVGLNLLTGPNGIGKSSFLNALKHDVLSIFSKRKVAFMDQFPLAPVNEVRLLDVLKMMSGSFEHFDQAQARRLIKMFDIDYLVNRSIKLLSGGENQLVKFILAASQRVDFYFLDEPLQFLDKEKLKLVKSHLELLAKTSCVFIIEHQIDHLVDLEVTHFGMKQKKGRITIYGN